MEGEEAESTAVTFRHLALLAQTKSTNEGVWNSLRKAGSITDPTQSLVDRLTRMRSWIASKHFPEEMKINVLQTPNTDALSELNEDERKALFGLAKNLAACPWDSEHIGSAIPQAAKDLGLSPKIGYRAAYTALMGKEKGPRLAPILAEMDQSEIVSLLNECVIFLR